MTILIHSTTVVTVDENDTVLNDGAVAIDADRIIAVGGTEDLLRHYPTAEQIDGSGRAVMPGFANTHTHLALTLARGVYEDLSPPNRPPFTGGLAPIPLPRLTPEER